MCITQKYKCCFEKKSREREEEIMLLKIILNAWRKIERNEFYFFPIKGNKILI